MTIATWNRTVKSWVLWGGGAFLICKLLAFFHDNGAYCKRMAVFIRYVINTILFRGRSHIIGRMLSSPVDLRTKMLSISFATFMGDAGWIEPRSVFIPTRSILVCISSEMSLRSGVRIVPLRFDLREPKSHPLSVEEDCITHVIVSV